MDILEEIVGSKTRAEIFRLLFEQADREFYLRELQRRSGMSLSPVQDEMTKLSKMGLVKSRQDGNRLYYRANSQHPLFPEIRGLVEKTSGVQALLRDALRDAEIRVAFIFGSIAKGKARPESDVDLLVIGDLGLRKLAKLLSGATERIGREINPHVMSVDEFHRKVQKKEHFISSVMSSEKIFVIGDEDELKRVGQK